jgi:cytochrome bd-type quinol oxidase subunit 2
MGYIIHVENWGRCVQANSMKLVTLSTRDRIVQKMQNHDFLWLLPFVACVLVLFAVAFQKRKRTNTKSQIQF